jgi:type IV pilus assembly protein PilM
MMPRFSTAGQASSATQPFGSIDIEAVAKTPIFIENAPRLYVACGVALQGLQKSVVATNLYPKPKNRLGRLGALLKSTPNAESAWGIDLSDSGLKAVRLVHRAQDDAVAVAVEAFDVVDHATPLPALINEAQRRDVVADTLKRFLERNPIKKEVVCISFPGAQALGRFLSVPPTEGKQTDELMHYEARQQIPIPLEQLKWDYHIWQPPVPESELPRDAMLVATKQYHISQRLQPFEDAGVRPDILQCDCIALYNFYRYAFAAETPNRNDNTWSILLDVGAEGTNVVACGGNGLWYRSLPRGGNDLSLALVRRAKLNFAQAEQLKRHPEQARRFSDLHEAWRPTFDQLLRDVRDSIEAFGKRHRRTRIDRIWLCGGGIRTHGLHRHLLA